MKITKMLGSILRQRAVNSSDTYLCYTVISEMALMVVIVQNVLCIDFSPVNV